MMRLTDRLSADHRAFQFQLDELERLTLDDASDSAVRAAAAAMQGAIGRHIQHDEELFGHLQEASKLDDSTLAELLADHNRTAFLFRSIASAEGSHLSNLCRTLVGLLRYHIGCEDAEVIPLANVLLGETVPQAETAEAVPA